MRKPVIWELKVFRSQWSKRIWGIAHWEGPRRRDVIRLMRRYLNTGVDDLVADLCKAALEGKERYTLVRARGQQPYLAQDLQWRGWDDESWKHFPPTAYLQVKVKHTPTPAYYYKLQDPHEIARAVEIALDHYCPDTLD